MISRKRKETTAGSLSEQQANATMQIGAARMANEGGYEVTGIGGRALQAWSAAFEATFVILRRALDTALSPGTADDIESATSFIGTTAGVTRQAVRDRHVAPLREPTVRAIQKVIATGVARVDTKNAESACHAIIRCVHEEVSHLEARIEAAISSALCSSRLLDGIDEAIHAGDANLATIGASLRRLKSRAEAEPACIDEDLRASNAALVDAEQQLLVVARQTTQRRGSAATEVVRSVYVTYPKLTDERLSQMYLPEVRKRMGDVANALADRADVIDARLRAVRNAQGELRELWSDESARLNGNGRTQFVGIPLSEASRQASIQQIVDAIYPGISRELRNLIVWSAPAERILRELMTLVRARVQILAPSPSIDDVLLRDVDPKTVAHQLDAIVWESEVPVALEPGADRRRIRDLRCRVIRVPVGSRVAEAMSEHAGYRSDSFDYTGRPDRIEVVVVQPGMSLRQTRLFCGGDISYREEQADPASAPIETLNDAVLRALVPNSVRKTGGGQVKARPSKRTGRKSKK